MTDHDRTWNPLTDPDAPLGGQECEACEGEGRDLSYEDYYQECEVCSGTGRTPPWGKVECGKCSYGVDCEFCDSIGIRPLRVLVEGDLFALWCRNTKHGWHSQREAMQHCKEVISGPVSFATMFLPDDTLAHLFAIMAATPDVQYTIRTGYLERAEAWIVEVGHVQNCEVCLVCKALCSMALTGTIPKWGIQSTDDPNSRCPLCETSWPLPNVTIEEITT